MADYLLLQGVLQREQTLQVILENMREGRKAMRAPGKWNKHGKPRHHSGIRKLRNYVSGF